MEKVKKWSLIGCAAVLLALLITVWYTGASQRWGQREVAVTAAVLASESAENPQSMEQVARQWAQAVMARDGRGQYALMSRKLQAQVLKEMEELGWVTGTSSPWIENFTIRQTAGGMGVIFHYAHSSGAAGDYLQKLTFVRENGALKISDISKPKRVEVYMQRAWLDFDALTALLGETRQTLLETVGETPYPVGDGGLGFDRAGIRVWFDGQTGNRVSKILILPGAVDVRGVRIGEPLDSFEAVLGVPIEQGGGAARFIWGEASVWVGYDEQTGRTQAIMLAEQ